MCGEMCNRTKHPGQGDSKMKKILIIHTGGTIGMFPTERGYAPSKEAFHAALSAIPELSAPVMPAYYFMRKRKYSAELIISIVKERIEKETSWECLSAKYNIHHMKVFPYRMEKML